MTVRVLVVEDEPLAARAHTDYVARVPGFTVVGTVHSAGEAHRHLVERGAVDLVLLDMNLPDGHGLALLQRLRSTGHLCDVIAVTAARDPEVVRAAVAQGVVLYLLKPFSFASFRAKLEQYADYRRRLVDAPAEVVQEEVDQLLGALRVGAGPASLPKGLSAERLQAVTERLRASDTALSASELAGMTGTSRVTARRYLEHLADAALAERSLRQGGSGRPEVEYAWRSGAPAVTRPR